MVAAGLIPALIGGPIFALFMVALGVAAYREYLSLAAGVGSDSTSSAFTIGAVVLAAMGLAPLVSSDATLVIGLVFAATVLPLVAHFSSAREEGGMVRWSLVSAGMIYIGIPVYAAVALRSLPSNAMPHDLARIAQVLSLGWEPAPRGLAWALTVILATWVGDSSAYLTGKAFGRTKLAPSLSPGKTIEGAIGGLAGSVMVSIGTFLGFGIGPWWAGALAGLIIGAMGQVGDLAESFLKRQAGVKDSGAVIPGHGGILDRIDALLFAFPAGLIVASGFARLQG